MHRPSRASTFRCVLVMGFHPTRRVALIHRRRRGRGDVRGSIGREVSEHANRLGLTGYTFFGGSSFAPKYMWPESRSATIQAGAGPEGIRAAPTGATSTSARATAVSNTTEQGRSAAMETAMAPKSRTMATEPTDRRWGDPGHGGV